MIDNGNYKFVSTYLSNQIKIYSKSAITHGSVFSNISKSAIIELQIYYKI